MGLEPDGRRAALIAFKKGKANGAEQQDNRKPGGTGGKGCLSSSLSE